MILIVKFEQPVNLIWGIYCFCIFCIYVVDVLAGLGVIQLYQLFAVSVFIFSESLMYPSATTVTDQLITNCHSVSVRRYIPFKVVDEQGKQCLIYKLLSGNFKNVAIAPFLQICC